MVPQHAPTWLIAMSIGLHVACLHATGEEHSILWESWAASSSSHGPFIFGVLCFWGYATWLVSKASATSFLCTTFFFFEVWNSLNQWDFSVLIFVFGHFRSVLYWSYIVSIRNQQLHCKGNLNKPKKTFLVEVLTLWIF